MKKFILVYYGSPKHNSAEEAEKGMEAWKQWVSDLGDAITVPGCPAKPGKMISSEGVTDTDPDSGFSGYTIVQAESLDKAIEYVQKSPFISSGEKMSVHELAEMEK